MALLSNLNAQYSITYILVKDEDMIITPLVMVVPEVTL